MPESGRPGLGGFLKSLPSRLTPVVRTCLLVGLIIGCLLGLYSGLGGPKDEAANIVVERPASGSVPWIIGGWTFAGAVFGTLLGVGVEVLFRESDKPDKNKPWWKNRKASRRKN